ncbi:MAG: hypothetical protein LT080_03345 [Thiobacillus sp.]|nr:hypothetical protein [Thiobacillus sp.]
MDEIISERLDAIRYQKMMAKEVPTATHKASPPAYIDESGNEYEDDSYVTDEMVEDLRIKADNE